MKRRASFQHRSQHKWKSSHNGINSFMPISNPFVSRPKIAFLFIARNRLPLDFVWDLFFRVEWGEASMIQAERVLLENALMDPSNERFVFLSDSYTYDYVMSTPTSFVDSFADTKEGRYNPKMDPIIPFRNWRKGSQWVVLNRKHAETVVKDGTLFPVFQQHCKQEGLEEEITRRSLTYTGWDLSASRDRERRGWHPVTYKHSDATHELIQSIKEIDNIRYDTENRIEWCSSKGKPAPCFLFARKFTRPAAIRLLNMEMENKKASFTLWQKP
ncbi:hypothetical protein Cgig2_021049 [Carnegiea gigantea]|uniref:Core-2/I-branching beta-1,6-N-acetylglucosaminyltransferase family protein n=1 Tax=Carnegiea gigantea TaxID=171969 RepID=A0A9Q1JQ46_9CARY|nr:hypothetical protein Cgig2_021049 [Carnegiea gigantea]